MTDKELLQQALDALTRLDGWLKQRTMTGLMPSEQAIVTALRERLAREEQNPGGMEEWQVQALRAGWSMPARQWQGLSEEEIALLEWAVSTLSDFSASDRARPAWQFVYMPKLADLRNMAEQHKAKLKEKNG